MNPSSLSTENIVATAVAGLGIGIIAIWKYLKELKAPTAPNGDRIVPGLALADMKPFDKIAAALERSAVADERSATAIEAVMKHMREQSQEEEIDGKIERRIENLLAKLDLPPSTPRHRRT